MDGWGELAFNAINSVDVGLHPVFGNNPGAEEWLCGVAPWQRAKFKSHESLWSREYSSICLIQDTDSMRAVGDERLAFFLPRRVFPLLLLYRALELLLRPAALHRRVC